MAAGMSVFVQIGAKIGSSFGSSVRAAESRLDKMARHVKLRSAEMKAHLRGMEGSLSRFATNVSMPAGLAVGMGGRFAYEWSKVGNELQAVTQMSMVARKQVEAAARAMPGNPAENLKAALDIGRTGYDRGDIISALLPTTIKLGMSDSSVDVAGAADIMTNVMKGMKMPDSTFAQTKSSAERVANNIAFAAAKSSSDVRLMGESFKYAAPLAARLNIPIERLSAYFMTMADAGIKGSESGVALRSGMVRLLKPTKAAMAVLAKYNMTLADYTGGQSMTGKSIADQLSASGFKADAGQLDRILASDLSGAALTQKITEAVANGISDGAGAADLDAVSTAVNNAMLGGSDKMDFTKFLQDVTKKGWKAEDIVRFFDVRQGARLMTLTGEDMAKNFERVESAMRAANGQGSFLDKMYLMQMQGAVGPWERMKQAMGNLVIAMADSGAMDSIANALNSIAKGVMWIANANPAILRFGTYLLMAVAAAAPLGFILSGIRAGAGVLVGSARMIGTALMGMWRASLPLRMGLVALRAVGLVPLLAALAPVGLALAGIALAIGWIVAKWDGLKAFFSGFAQGFTEAFGPAMPALRSAIDSIKTAMAPLAPLFGAVRTAFEWVFGPPAVASWGNAGKIIGTIIGTLARAVATLFAGLLKVQGAMASLGGMVLGSIGVGAAPGGAKRVPGRALGGSVSAGQTVEWHERGREFFTPGRSGTVIPAHVVAAMNRSAGQGGNTVNATINIYDARDSNAVAAQVDARLRQLAVGQSALLND